MKDIKGYEGKYAITSCGKVWSHKRKKFLKQFDNGYGYLFVRLSSGGKAKNCRVNRLVAEAYISNPENKPQVGHKDENRYNNSVNNLYWTTCIENNNYGNRNKRISIARSKKVRCIELDQIFNNVLEAMAATGVDNSAIGKCCNKKQKTAGKYHWEWVIEK